MKLTKILAAAILSVTVASANDVMQKSMTLMQEGIEKVQAGFINNNAALIKNGLQQIENGNTLFSTKNVIAKYLPTDKVHMVNIAVNASKRIKADTTIIDLNLDEKAYLKAAEGYSDMLNACSRCHGLVRNW